MNSVKSLWDMWSVLWDNMSTLIEYFMQPLSTAYVNWLNSPLGSIITLPGIKQAMIALVENSSLGSISLAEFMLGGGIVTIVIVSIIKWVIGIIM